MNEQDALDRASHAIGLKLLLHALKSGQHTAVTLIQRVLGAECIIGKRIPQNYLISPIWQKKTTQTWFDSYKFTPRSSWPPGEALLVHILVVSLAKVAWKLVGDDMATSMCNKRIAVSEICLFYFVAASIKLFTFIQHLVGATTFQCVY